MVDNLTVERRSENMRRIRAKDTKPEMVVRSLVHALGFRYRLHNKLLPGKPDLVFASRHKVIFVHGCFWHGHDSLACPDRRTPKSNQGYWNPKLARNKERDAEHVNALRKLGWSALTLWECELKDLGAIESAVVEFLK
jgi:DNA mismatch endonuclease (patch repair protein)